jgi:hypothetical protein
MENNEIAGLLFNTGALGAFIYFSLRLLKEMREWMDKQNERWAVVVKELSESHSKGMSRIAEEVKANTALLMAHDKQASDFIAEQRGRKSKAKSTKATV